MRKLKLQVQMSVDGCIAGSNGEMDFLTWNWDDKLKEYVTDITSPVETIILGRKLAQGFIPHWQKVITNPEDPDFEFGKRMCGTAKIVFTRTLDKSEWDNTKLATSDLVDEINKIKMQAGGDIMVYGGGNFVSNLIKEGLIDEYHLFINPASIGSGMTIFKGLEKKQDLVLKKSIGFDCGIVLICYEFKRG